MKTTKTIEAWYEHLPEPIRSEALSARKRALNRYGVNRYAYSLAEALLEGFGWRVDGGNSKKWSSIHTQAMNGEFDKPDTAPTAPSADEIQDLRKRIEELERYICEHKQHATMDRHGLIAVVARRIADEHRKHGKTLAEGDEWASIAAAKILGTLSEMGMLNKAPYQKCGKSLTMQDVMLACGELNKRERVAVQWVLDRCQPAEGELARHGTCPPHVIYEAVGGGMICSGCEQRFVRAEHNVRHGFGDDEIAIAAEEYACGKDGHINADRAIGYEDAMRWFRDNGYLAPAPLDVEEILHLATAHLQPIGPDLDGMCRVTGRAEFRKALEAYALSNKVVQMFDKGFDVEGVMNIVAKWESSSSCGSYQALRKALEAYAENIGSKTRKDGWISVKTRLPDMDIEMHGAMGSGVQAHQPMTQREIRFRAWDGGKMHYNVLAGHGDYAADHEDDVIWWWHEPPKAIMQYTGMTDKNGADIYEGDVVRSMYGDCVVRWNDNECGFEQRAPDGLGFVLDIDERRHYEVIGNIYENPELLKQ